MQVPSLAQGEAKRDLLKDSSSSFSFFGEREEEKTSTWMQHNVVLETQPMSASAAKGLASYRVIFSPVFFSGFFYQEDGKTNRVLSSTLFINKIPIDTLAATRSFLPILKEKRRKEYSCAPTWV
jgi:hypothetical protein